MKNVTEFVQIFLCTQAVDFRKGVRGLSVCIHTQFQEDPFQQGALFVFLNRQRDAVKFVYWDKTGFALWHKILEKDKFPRPKNSSTSLMSLSPIELTYILNGVDIFKIKPHQELKYTHLI